MAFATTFVSVNDQQRIVKQDTRLKVIYAVLRCSKSVLCTNARLLPIVSQQNTIALKY